MNGGKPVRVLLAVLVGWTVLREAEVGPLRPLLHGPAFGKLAYWIVIVTADGAEVVSSLPKELQVVV